VSNGGGLVATGETSLYDEQGQKRDDFALSDLFGVHATGVHHGSSTDDRKAWDEWGQHTYLRLSPERRRWVYGPTMGDEPDEDAPRHRVLAEFDETDTIPFGGRLEVVIPSSDVKTPLTFIPPFPIYPPETAWMRTPASSLPALVLNEAGAQGKVAYLPADLDTTFGRHQLPDHARLLANLVRWSANDQMPIEVSGTGFLDCRLYQQQDRKILHIVNLSGFETSQAPAYEYYPAGPVEVRLATERRSSQVKMLVADEVQDVVARDGSVCITIDSIADHEVLVIEP
jgi:hypothetical protein